MTGRLPVLGPLDRRLNAFHAELADIRLSGKVAAPRFVEGVAASVFAPVCDLRREPRHDCPIDHQLLAGETVRRFDERDGWSFVQEAFSGYVGWAPSEALTLEAIAATHVVCVPRSFVYPGADLKFPSSRALSMGSRVCVTGETVTRGSRYLLLASGEALFAGHLRPLEVADSDYVAVARRFLGTPYLWGGTSGFGVDCSGLVHLAMRMCGRAVLRDSDMQAATLGEEIDPGPDLADLARGDLVFWRGHVAIVEGDGNLLHASGHVMQVVSEPLKPALDRIAGAFEPAIGFRRP